MTNQTNARDVDLAQSYDLNAERIVLGCMMTTPAAITAVDGKLTGDDFYRPKNGQLFTAIMEAHEVGQPTEPYALAGILADRGILTDVGGAPFLHECVAMVPTSAQVGWYRDRLLDCADRRTAQVAGVKLTAAASSAAQTSEDLATLAESLLGEVQSRRGRQQQGMTELGSLINPGLADIGARAKRPLGVMTGFTDLDRLLGGLRRKQLITVAGATGMGKSIFVVDVARHAAIRCGLTVALFTFEMSQDEVFDRILSAEARVSHHVIRQGTLDEADWDRVINNIGPMSNAPLYLLDKSAMRVADIARYCRQLKASPAGLDLVIVDHMHLVMPSSPRLVDQYARITDVSGSLKRDLAGELDVPVLAAAQFSRAPGARSDKTPELTDLKGSSAIEQDSNIVILLHRPDYYDPESPRSGEADVIVAKNRSGAKDTITVAAQLHLSRFVDMAVV